MDGINEVKTLFKNKLKSTWLEFFYWSFTSDETPFLNKLAVKVIASSFDTDSYEITDTLLNDRAVILDLSKVNKAVGQRLIDFTAGSVYALDGSMQKISEYIFLICPADVGIVGDKREEDEDVEDNGL